MLKYLRVGLWGVTAHKHQTVNAESLFPSFLPYFLHSVTESFAGLLASKMIASWF